jgi:hypothetical protein
LKESDIPGRTKVRSRIDEKFKEHMALLQHDVGVSFILLNFDVLLIIISECSWESFIYH